jgi:tRNA(adenine34) deaminase
MDGAVGFVMQELIEDDERFMREALSLAAAAGRDGEVPIAALVVLDGNIIGRGANRVIRDGDTTAHAEIVALRDAFREVNNYRVPGATVYTTVEPCAMCAGALLHARVSRVVWGAPDAKFGAAGSVFNLFNETKLNHHAREIVGHICEADAAQLLKDFFSKKRDRKQSVSGNTASTMEVKTATWHDDQSTLRAIRFEVFVEEQGVPAEVEIDRFDPLCIHAIAWVGGQAAACGRLLPDGHIGRMAVRKPFRGRNIGAAVLEHLIAKATQRGDSESVLSAQTHAIAFYEKFGYVAHGAEYLDCGIAHRTMKKQLKGSACRFAQPL